MATFMIWNPEFLVDSQGAHYAGPHAPDSLQALLALEAETGVTQHSVVTLADAAGIEQLVAAFENEANVGIRYHLIEQEPTQAGAR